MKHMPKLLKTWLKVMDKESILIASALSVFLVLVLIIALLFVGMMDKRNEMLMQYTAEQTFATYFFRANWDAESTVDVFSGSGVVGLAAYDREGNLLLGLGKVPKVYNPPASAADDRNPRSGRAVYNRETGTIDYSRRMMLGITIGSDLFKVPDILYIAIDGRSYRLTRIRLYSFYGLFSMLTVLFMVFVWRLYARNKSYRQTIERQKSLVSLGEAARTLAHEIKNPLSAITLQTAVLRKTLPEAAHAGLLTIDEQTRRLNSLADRIREFIRNSAGNPAVVDLPEFIREVASFFGSSVRVEEGEFEARSVWIDRERARSAFENLIRNALESRGEGNDMCSESDGDLEEEDLGLSETRSPAPDVCIVVSSTRSAVAATILDDGDGLPAGHEDEIFDPFFTTKTRGSGIGLAIARRFIEGAGGTLKLYSRSETEGLMAGPRGTAAEVVFPACRSGSAGELSDRLKRDARWKRAGRNAGRQTCRTAPPMVQQKRGRSPAQGSIDESTDCR